MIYDAHGKFLVRAIFWEISTPERRLKLPPLYTLKVEPSHGLPSAYQIYMNSIDEYDAGIKIAGNMKNWRNLAKASWFLKGWSEHSHEGLIQWRKDMEARDKSLAKAQLQEKAEEGNVSAMTKLYNISPKKIDKRIKKEIKEDKTSKIIDIAERMQNK